MVYAAYQVPNPNRNEITTGGEVERDDTPLVSIPSAINIDHDPESDSSEPVVRGSNSQPKWERVQ